MLAPDFWMIETNGVTLRTVAAGAGPLVILLHGWPQCWYLWRHPIAPLAAAGYRVAVPDLRGFGGSSAPAEVDAYNIRNMAADVVGLAAALGAPQFKLIGHDWGCIVAWNTALLDPTACRAVLGLAVPFWRAGHATIDPPGMDDLLWYIRYLQAPGVIEAELEADIRASLPKIHWALSADAPPLCWMKQLEFPRGSRFLDVLPTPPALPAWLNDEDLAYATAQLAGAAAARALYVATNMADPVSVGRLFEAVAARQGRLDLLFNNAGVDAPQMTIDEMTVAQWRAVVDTKLNGAFHCAREAFAQMRRQRSQGGRIINNGSISAYVPRPGTAVYTATKHATTGLTRTPSLDRQLYDIACGQIDIGNAAPMRTGIRQADGSVRAEPLIDVAHAASAVRYMAHLPLSAYVQFMTVMATAMPFIGRG